MSLYRKKPVVIEARPYDGSWECACELIEWMSESDPTAASVATWTNSEQKLSVPTKEGPLNASPGDFLIRGTAGEFYPCKPDIFAAIYEPAA